MSSDKSKASRTKTPNVTELLRAWTRGDTEAGEQVAEVIYGELHRRAAAHIRRERNHHTLSPTDLLHDVFLQLARQHVEWANRAQFYGTACQMMRRALVDHARARSAAKRGGLRVELTEELVSIGPSDVDVLALDEALTELSKDDPRQAQLVELRFLQGFRSPKQHRPSRCPWQLQTAIGDSLGHGCSIVCPGQVAVASKPTSDGGHAGTIQGFTRSLIRREISRCILTTTRLRFSGVRPVSDLRPGSR